MKLYGIAVVSLAGALVWTSVGQAQVNIKVPFVQVSTGGPGGGVFVKAPFVTVDVPPKYPVYYPQVPIQPGTTAPGNQLPQPKPFMPPADNMYIVPPQQPGVVVPSQPGVVFPSQPGVVVPSPKYLTHREFAQSFIPTPGTYKVTLIHPGSGCPVDVCFTLPPGCPKVRVGHRYIEFDYGHCREVEIRFALFGKVRVEYHN